MLLKGAKVADREYDPRQTEVPRRPSMLTTGQTEARKLHASVTADDPPALDRRATDELRRRGRPNP